MKMKKMAIVVGLCLSSWALRSAPLVPMTPAHEEYLARGIMAIVHWGPNTYTDKEWGFGNADPACIQPARLAPAQWVRAMKAAEIKSVVLVAKHHDGFCLWPSKYNADYSMSAVSGRYNDVNVVKAVARACRQEGMAFGVYLSPWDRHQGNYATADYVTYFHNQWQEMFSGDYGKICEIWLDGANGGDGWYGGVNGGKGERRKIPDGYYRKGDLLKALVRHNPKGVAFGGHGENSVAWCGNERGSSPEIWNYARRGDDGKMHFMPPEADTPLRGGWFYHGNQHPKPLKQMVKCYFESVGRGGVLNWGIAPSKTGSVCDEDVKRLKEFGDYVRAFNALDFSRGASIEKQKGERSDSITFHLAGAVAFNAVDFGEDLTQGQLVSKWTVEAWIKNEWKTIAKGTCAGYRRIVRFDEVKSDRVRIMCQGSEKRPTIMRPAVRYAAVVKDTGEVEYGETDTAKWMTGKEREKK